jgi:acyl-coenzyme A synthetase/AMP-(fatty) acid ligase
MVPGSASAFVEATLASNDVGLDIALISDYFAVDEIAYILEQCEAKLLVAQERFVSMVSGVCVNRHRSRRQERGTSSPKYPA